MAEKNIAVEVAKGIEEKKKGDAVKALKSGARVRVSRVSQLLIDEAVHAIDEPEVPYVMDEDRGYAVANPDDPKYLQRLREYERKQIQATFDICLIFGIELVDGVPEDDTWLKNLQFISKRNPHIDLSQFDLNDSFEKEFVYKRFVAVDGDELSELMRDMTEGVTEEDVEKARDLFRDN